MYSRNTAMIAMLPCTSPSFAVTIGSRYEGSTRQGYGWYMTFSSLLDLDAHTREKHNAK